MTAPVAAPAIARVLERTVGFTLTRAADGSRGDGRNFSGYAAVFNSVTRIDSWEGVFDEQIAPGAFRKTIRERTPVLQFDHGRHPFVGSIPIGAIRSLQEDEKGLFVDARIAGNWMMEPVREAIENESINGMSFRFEVVKDDWVDKAGKRITDRDELMRLLFEPGERGPLLRTLREVKMPELGPVVFPAYPDTTASVRSREIAHALARDPDLLRQLRADMMRSMFQEADLAQSALQENLNGRPKGDAREVARVFLFEMRNGGGGGGGNRTEDVIGGTVSPDSVEPVNNDTEETDNIQTSEGEPELATPGEDSPPDTTQEAPAEPEPPAQHSDTNGEPPTTGHSEPAPEAPRFENLDAKERQVARMRMAETIRARKNAALERAQRHSDD